MKQKVVKKEEKGIIILEENSDNEFEPNEEEIVQYAQFLGIDTVKDKQLLYIAYEGLKAKVPDPWKVCRSSNGDINYMNMEDKSISEEHPCDRYYKMVVELQNKEIRKFGHKIMLPKLDLDKLIKELIVIESNYSNQIKEYENIKKHQYHKNIIERQKKLQYLNDEKLVKSDNFKKKKQTLKNEFQEKMDSLIKPKEYKVNKFKTNLEHEIKLFEDDCKEKCKKEIELFKENLYIENKRKIQRKKKESKESKDPKELKEAKDAKQFEVLKLKEISKEEKFKKLRDNLKYEFDKSRFELMNNFKNYLNNFKMELTNHISNFKDDFDKSIDKSNDKSIIKLGNNQIEESLKVNNNFFQEMVNFDFEFEKSEELAYLLMNIKIIIDSIINLEEQMGILGTNLATSNFRDNSEFKVDDSKFRTLIGQSIGPDANKTLDTSLAKAKLKFNKKKELYSQLKLKLKLKSQEIQNKYQSHRNIMNINQTDDFIEKYDQASHELHLLRQLILTNTADRNIENNQTNHNYEKNEKNGENEKKLFPNIFLFPEKNYYNLKNLKNLKNSNLNLNLKTNSKILHKISEEKIKLERNNQFAIDKFNQLSNTFEDLKNKIKLNNQLIYEGEESLENKIIRDLFKKKLIYNKNVIKCKIDSFNNYIKKIREMKKSLKEIENLIHKNKNLNLNLNINSSSVGKIFRSYLDDSSIIQKRLERLLRQNYLYKIDTEEMFQDLKKKHSHKQKPRDISPIYELIQKFHRIINKIFNNHQFEFIVNRKLISKTFIDQSNWINRTRKNLGNLPNLRNLGNLGKYSNGIYSQRLFSIISH